MKQKTDEQIVDEVMGKLKEGWLVEDEDVRSDLVGVIKTVLELRNAQVRQQVERLKQEVRVQIRNAKEEGDKYTLRSLEHILEATNQTFADVVKEYDAK